MSFLLSAFIHIVILYHVLANEASLTHFESYPTDQTECHKYSGCKYEGLFAFVDGKKSKEWVKNHNIISVHERDAAKYKLKKFKIHQNGRTIEAIVYDECADSDCGGCCTRNAAKYGFLIDMEKYTYQRFGAHDGKVEWECVDC